MSKSIKLRDDSYIDSTSITHDRNKLSDLLNDTGWIDITLNSDWKSTGDSYTPQYRKIGNMVVLRGLAQKTSSTSGSRIATLPYAPTLRTYFSVATQLSEDNYKNYAKAVYIQPSGLIQVIGDDGNLSTGNWVALSGIYFFID